MSLFTSLLLLPGLGLAAGSGTLDQSPTTRDRVAPTPAEGQVIVRFDDPTTLTEAAAQLEGQPFVVDRALMPRIDLYLLLIAEEMDVSQAIEHLESLPQIRYAAPDMPVEQRGTSNDSYFSQQWGMHNTGQSGGTVDADIDAPEAWDLGTGSRDFVIAIVDGGAQHNHPDLVANRWQNDAEVNGTNGVDDDGNGYVDDRYGWNAYNNNGSIPSDSHGTHVAGIAGARGNNNTGVAGVNWDCELMHIAGASGSTSTVLAAYNYALVMRDLYVQSGGTSGANVVAINSSFGIDYANCNSATYQPWNDAYNAMGASGILNAAATINSNQNVDIIGDVPTGCSSPWMVAVTNTDRYDNKAYAGYGSTHIDLGAPGSSVLSTVPNNTYSSYSGTSMATPHVTGAIAFLHSLSSQAFRAHFATAPDQAALTLKEILLQSVDVIPSLNGITVSNGRLNLHQAAQEIMSWGDSPNYCQTSPNSAGPGELITFSGSTSYSSNSFTLNTSGGVPNEFGLFYYGPNQIEVPFGNGWRCVGGGVTRLSPAATNDGSGNATRWVDFTQPEAAAITAGSTWNFQHWYRDTAAGGSGFNFSDGLSVTILP